MHRNKEGYADPTDCIAVGRTWQKEREEAKEVLKLVVNFIELMGYNLESNLVIKKSSRTFTYKKEK